MSQKIVTFAECKNNQIMEFGDIIFYILMILIFVFGIVNDVRKKNAKKTVSKTTQPIDREEEPREVIGEKNRQSLPPRRKMVVRGNHAEESKAVAPPPVLREFKSSLDSAIQTEGQSSIDYTPVDDNYDYAVAEADKSMQRPTPLAAVFSGREELIRAVVYSEILKRKY